MGARAEGSPSTGARAGETPRAIGERLELALEWYEGMISERTGRLLYTYEPERDIVFGDGSPIRDIASVWDVEVLGRFLGRPDLDALVERSLEYYSGYLVPRDGASILDPARLGEPSGIAHSAFMMLCLLDSGRPGEEAEIAALAEGILAQQRRDGSYRVYFDGAEDDGIEFYPGEAMLALMEAYRRLGDARHLSSVERGFRYHRDHLPAAGVRDGLLVFYANWQSQYAALLHSTTRDEALRAEVRDYVFSLHDEVVRGGFCQSIERHPRRQATVEVACALEGLNDAFAIAARERDEGRARAYERCIRAALQWLFRAQRLERCTARERGGFGHSLTERTQRIDVTGHAIGGFMKTASNGIGA